MCKRRFAPLVMTTMLPSDYLMVDAELKNGKIINLKVLPESRKKDVVMML